MPTELINQLPPNLDASQLRIAEAVNHAISVLAAENRKFWSQTTETILATLNSDLSRTVTIFAGNKALAKALNVSQDTLNVRDGHGNLVYPLRAPLGAGRADIVFDGAAWITTNAPEA